MRINLIIYAALVLGGIFLLAVSYRDPPPSQPPRETRNVILAEVGDIQSNETISSRCKCFSMDISYGDFTEVVEGKRHAYISLANGNRDWYELGNTIDQCHTVSVIEPNVISISCGDLTSDFPIGPPKTKEDTLSDLMPQGVIIHNSVFEELIFEYKNSDLTEKKYLQLVSDPLRESEFYGLQVGDKIISIDDHPISKNKEGFRRQLKKAIENEYVIIKVDRFGEVFDMNLTLD